MKNALPNEALLFTVDADDPFGLVGRVLGERVAGADGRMARGGVLIDRGEDIVDRADALPPEELEEAIGFLIEDGIFAGDWSAAYLGRVFAIEGLAPLRFDGDSLHRAAVKFGWVLGGCDRAEMDGAHLALDRTEKPATTLEHLFLGLELRRRGLNPATLTLRLPGWWEPAIDFDGDAAEVERVLAGHLAVARFCGGYRLRISEAAGKVSLLPRLTRVGGERVHFDLSGACWLEAMRTLVRCEALLFREVLRVAQEHFPLDRSGQRLSTGEEDVRALPEVGDETLEEMFLGDPRGRQLLHVTEGSILGQTDLRGRLHEALARHEALYSELAGAMLKTHLGAP